METNKELQIKNIKNMEKFKIRKILIPTDFSETAGKALKQAIFMAKTAKADLKLLYVIAPEMNFEANTPIPQGKAFYDNLGENIGTKLNDLCIQINKEHSIEASYELKLGVVYKEICDTAEKENFDIIIMGTHGVSGIDEFFAGSNASKVVAQSDCPVITIQKEGKTGGFKNIILPIKLEINSRQKVDYVIELAKLFSSTVFIVGFTDEKNESAKTRVKQYVMQVEKYLTEFDINYKSTVLYKDNFIDEIMLHAKENNADLIAIINKHDFSFDQIIKGSYTKQFVNHSVYPILSIPVYSDPDLMIYTPYLSGELPE
jgi:nucleotide-binding universal stress UspA family protein